ncbi:MAG: hypothetical protein KF861_15840, partial [Planctomycetaceae bacterium]|nr:hypothetical protein [Planctomycetaceae bacterium]
MALIGRISLIAHLLAAPWVFGGVTPEAQWWLSLGVAGLLVLHLIESLVERPSGPFHLPTAVLAPVGLLVIAAVQLLPRDEPLVPRMQHAVFAELAETFGSDGPVTGTVSPASTRTQASLLFFALGAFVLGSRWFSTGPSQIWLWRALAINGAALAFFGIVQKLTWNGLLFWSVPLRQGGTPFASFVNRNNAAGYLNLCLAAALGVVILR